MDSKLTLTKRKMRLFFLINWHKKSYKIADYEDLIKNGCKKYTNDNFTYM